MFNQDVIAAVKAAKFCRVVVYPAVRGWSGERIQLEVADNPSALGHTDWLRGAGHWLVVDMAPRQVVEEVERLRGSQVSVLRGELRLGFCPYLGLVLLLVWLCKRECGSGYCQLSKGVISDLEPEEVARQHHLAELETMVSYSNKDGIND